MKYNLIITILFLANNLFCQNNNQNIKFPPVTMTNFVEFNDSKFNNPIAGCSFLVATIKDTFAVTCKHALWVAKSDEMKCISFENTLKQWRMQRKDDTTKYVITDKLLNENKNELIGEENVNSDYLVFSIRENHSDVKPLKLRTTGLEENETLFIVGWTFQDRIGEQRIYEVKYVKSLANKILVEMPALNLAGTSGSPVLDKNGLLVGIVSNYTQDAETQKWYGSPCNTNYLMKIVND